MDWKLKKQQPDENEIIMIEKGYIPYKKFHKIEDTYHFFMTKLDLVRIFFPDEPMRCLHKRLKRAKMQKRYTHSMIQLQTFQFDVCIEKCCHEENQCLSYKYDQEVILLQLVQIPEQYKLNHWIHKDAFEPLRQIFL